MKQILISLLVCVALRSEATDLSAARKALVDNGIEKIVYAERTFATDPHWYANFGYRYDGPRNKLYGDKGRLCILNVSPGKVTALIDDPKGAVRDPQVHYDAQKILFSYRKGGTAQYHLYEINVDGKGLKQLTDGIYDDIEPTYMPDGNIMFISSRSKRWVNCWQVQVANLYRCDGQGGNIRRISSNIETDNSPWMLPDGRVIFTRWEYVDRSQVKFHHLWTCNPDGTSMKAYYGNMHPGGLFIDAKPIPGSDRVLYINSPYHGIIEHFGRVATVTDKNGPDAKDSDIIISKGRFRDPYPITDKLFLALRNPTNMVVLTQDGNYTVIHTTETPIHEPRPLIKRERERIRPSQVNPLKATGTLILNNVYIGRNMDGIKKGEIKKLLILETLPKPINYGAGMHDFIPLSHGGTFTLERILGTVPVEKDGSAHFEVPANRPLFFIALNKKKESVKRMHSFLSVMPGEIQSCVGCHEERINTPQVRGSSLKAMKRKASRIKPLPGVPFTIDFPRDIQPILDKHCIKCHNPDKPEGRTILTGDNGPIFSLSYFTLAGLGYVSDGRNGLGNSAPRSVGDSASELMKLLNRSHHKVKPSRAEIEMIRNWIHVAAPYPGTYAALGTGMIVAKQDRKPELKGRMLESELPEKGHAARIKASEAFELKCGSCHGGKRLPRLDNCSLKGRKNRNHRYWDAHLCFNLTKPEKSALLMAPLAKEAGGWGSCSASAPFDKLRATPDKTVEKQGLEVFKDRNDLDYKVMLAWIEEGKKALEKNKRWNMPGFKPHPYYIREMKRYGILPEAFDMDKEDLDVYKLDRNYFEMSWYHPEGSPKLHENKELSKELKKDRK